MTHPHRPRMEPRDEAHARRLETWRRAKSKLRQKEARQSQTEAQLAAILREHRGPEERRALIASIAERIKP